MEFAASMNYEDRVIASENNHPQFVLIIDDHKRHILAHLPYLWRKGMLTHILTHLKFWRTKPITITLDDVMRRHE